MKEIIIFTDSTCDLSKDLIEKYKIKVLPLHVTFDNGGQYLDGVDIFCEDVYKKQEELNTLPKTGAINVSEFMKAFEEEYNKGNDIFYIGIGSGLSSSFNNAVIASKEFEDESRFAIVDGQNLSTGTGLLVIKACKFRDEGMSLKDIKENVEKLVPLVSTKFCIDRLDYLYKGGRCSGMTMIFAHALKIHPIAKIINNKLVVYKKPRGKYVNAVNEQIEEFKKDLPNMDTSSVFITHSGRIDGFDKYIYDELVKYIPKENIHITEAGCTVCSHCGPKTIGILYILNS